MEAEYLAVDERCEWEAVEQIGEIFPYTAVSILAKTFVVKPVDLNKKMLMIIQKYHDYEKINKKNSEPV